MIDKLPSALGVCAVFVRRKPEEIFAATRVAAEIVPHVRLEVVSCLSSSHPVPPLPLHSLQKSMPTLTRARDLFFR